jgi:hypothetical protein
VGSPKFSWVAGYIFIITVLIVFVQRKYYETTRPVIVPSLRRRPPAQSKKAMLKFSEIVQLEFEYVKETASQAMNDRLTLVNYFLLSAGVVLAGFGLMVSYEGGARFAYRYEVLVSLSLLFNSVGWVYFMQIVRLRQAWCESARAMNHLKLLYVENCELFSEDAKKVFRWDVESIPKAEKKMTVFYLSALLISILSAAAIALASIILLCIDLFRAADATNTYFAIPLGYLATSFGLGLYHLFFQMSMYSALLEESAPAKDEQNEEKIPLHPRQKKTEQ